MDFPHDFINLTGNLPGVDFSLLANALQEDAPVSIRINPAKQAPLEMQEKVMWCDTGYYLPERPSFTFDPLFQAGNYYVQEASSMFLEQAVRQYIQTPVTCLDLCAAPGGKSTHLLSILPEKSLLISNEVIRSRSAILTENLSKWGSPFSIVTNNDPKEIGLIPHIFDLIVADLPCSGEGMFRKDIKSRKEWSTENIHLCALRQRRIIHDIWDALKPGGLLIYSTCTFNNVENEENVRYIQETFHADILPVTVDTRWQVSGAIDEEFPAYRFFPHLTKGEGFFLAVLRKPEDPIKYTIPVNKYKIPVPETPAFVHGWIKDEYAYTISLLQNRLTFFPSVYTGLKQFLSGKLRVIAAGTTLGETKGKTVIPSTELALCPIFNRNAFPSFELSWKDAIRFLQKEALVLPPDIPKGFIVITYKQQPLGFVKHIGNRANNLYPQEWRIRSKKLPELIPDIF